MTRPLPVADRRYLDRATISPDQFADGVERAVYRVASDPVADGATYSLEDTRWLCGGCIAGMDNVDRAVESIVERSDAEHCVGCDYHDMDYIDGRTGWWLYPEGCAGCGIVR